MTTGSREFGSPDTGPLYSLRTWWGRDDPRKRAENAYRMTSIKESRSPGQKYYSGIPKGGPTYEYVTINWAPSLSLWSSNEELALLSRLADKVREGAPDMATAMGELPETLGSLSNLLSAAFSGWRSFRKGRFGDAVRKWSRFGSGGGRGTLRFKDVSDAHLALTYGWVPLAGDISDLCEWIEKRTAEPRTLKFRTSRTLRAKGSVGVKSGIPIIANGEIIVGMRLTMTERVSVPRSLGLLNPANVAWELVPFSFVVDWFVPIGSYLDNLGFFWGLDYKCTRAVIRRGRVKHYPGVFTFADSFSHIQIVGGGVTNSTCHFDREPNYSVSVPRPSLQSMRKAFSLQHVENAAALVWSGIHSLRTK